MVKSFVSCTCDPVAPRTQACIRTHQLESLDQLIYEHCKQTAQRAGKPSNTRSSSTRRSAAFSSAALGYPTATEYPGSQAPLPAEAFTTDPPQGSRRYISTRDQSEQPRGGGGVQASLPMGPGTREGMKDMLSLKGMYAHTDAIATL